MAGPKSLEPRSADEELAYLHTRWSVPGWSHFGMIAQGSVVVVSRR